MKNWDLWIPVGAMVATVGIGIGVASAYIDSHPVDATVYPPMTEHQQQDLKDLMVPDLSKHPAPGPSNITEYFNSLMAPTDTGGQP